MRSWRSRRQAARKLDELMELPPIDNFLVAYKDGDRLNLLGGRGFEDGIDEPIGEGEDIAGILADHPRVKIARERWGVVVFFAEPEPQKGFLKKFFGLNTHFQKVLAAVGSSITAIALLLANIETVITPISKIFSRGDSDVAVAVKSSQINEILQENHAKWTINPPESLALWEYEKNFRRLQYFYGPNRKQDSIEDISIRSNTEPGWDVITEAHRDGRGVVVRRGDLDPYSLLGTKMDEFGLSTIITQPTGERKGGLPRWYISAAFRRSLSDREVNETRGKLQKVVIAVEEAS